MGKQERTLPLYTCPREICGIAGRAEALTSSESPSRHLHGRRERAFKRLADRLGAKAAHGVDRLERVCGRSDRRQARKTGPLSGSAIVTLNCVAALGSSDSACPARFTLQTMPATVAGTGRGRMVRTVVVVSLDRSGESASKSLHLVRGFKAALIQFAPDRIGIHGSTKSMRIHRHCAIFI